MARLMPPRSGATFLGTDTLFGQATRSAAAQEVLDAGGDLQVLTRGDHQRADRGAGGADVGVRLGAGIELRVDAYAQVGEPASGALADLGGMLPDAPREHDAVESAEAGRHGGDAGR